MSPLPGRLLLVPALLLWLAATGCGTDEPGAASPAGPETSSTPPSAPVTPVAGSCPEVVPPAVADRLGWSAGDGAVEDRGGCFLDAEEGTILVLQVGETYDEACSRLRDAAPEGSFRPSFEDPAGLQACGYVRDGDLGQSELVLLDPQDRVISIGVAATEPTAPARVRAALLALTRTAPELA